MFTIRHDDSCCSDEVRHALYQVDKDSGGLCTGWKRDYDIRADLESTVHILLACSSHPYIIIKTYRSYLRDASNRPIGSCTCRRHQSYQPQTSPSPIMWNSSWSRMVFEFLCGRRSSARLCCEDFSLSHKHIQAILQFLV